MNDFDVAVQFIDRTDRRVIQPGASAAGGQDEAARAESPKRKSRGETVDPHDIDRLADDGCPHHDDDE